MSTGTKWPPIRPETPAWEVFGLALAEHLTPCRKGDAWTSEEPTERAAAIEACQPCPIRAACHDAADSTGEAFGVWAGVDRTKTAKEQRKSA